MGKDNINPSHYKDTCSIECIEAMECVLGTEGLLNFCLGNAFKYLWRFEHKNGIEDLSKAKWYVSKAETLVKDMEYPWADIYKHKIKSMRKQIHNYIITFGGKYDA